MEATDRPSRPLLVSLAITVIACIVLAFAWWPLTPLAMQTVLAFAQPPIAVIAGAIAVISLRMGEKPRWLGRVAIVAAGLAFAAYVVAGVIQLALFGR